MAAVVQSAFSADDDAKPTKPTGTNQKTAESQIWALEQAYWESWPRNTTDGTVMSIVCIGASTGNVQLYENLGE